MKKITINYPSAEEKAPLLVQVPGNPVPQDAYITLDLRDGTVSTATESIGGGMPADCWNNLVLRFPVSSDLSHDQVVEAMDSVADTLQTIYDNSDTRHDGSNWVGELNQAGSDAVDSMPELIAADVEGRVIMDPESWLMEGDLSDWMPEDGDDPMEFAEQVALGIEGDGYILPRPAEDILMDMWANHLYNGEVLPACVARALIEDGRCSDSAWTEELREFAEGN